MKFLTGPLESLIRKSASTHRYSSVHANVFALVQQVQKTLERFAFIADKRRSKLVNVSLENFQVYRSLSLARA